MSAANALNAFMTTRQFRQGEEDRALALEDRQRAIGLENTRGKINALMMQPGEGANRATGMDAGFTQGQSAPQPSRMDQARQMAVQSGSSELMGQFQQQLASMDAATREQNAAMFGLVGQVANSLRGVPVTQRGTALMAMAPQLQAAGVPDQEIQNYAQILSDPQSSDAVLEALSSRVLEAQSVFDAYAPQMQAENEVLSRFQNGQQVQGAVNPNASANRAIEQQNANARGLSAEASMLGSQARYQQAQTEAAGAPGERRNGQFTQERQLRQEFTGITSDYRDIQQSLGTIETMANRGDAQGDLALVVAFTKLLDPGSVAREGEVSLTQSSASTVQQASNWLNQLQRGNTILPQEVRAAFLSASQELAGQYRQSFDARRAEYSAIAQEYGLNADRVTIGGPSQSSANEPSIDDLLNQYGD